MQETLRRLNVEAEVGQNKKARKEAALRTLTQEELLPISAQAQVSPILSQVLSRP